MASARLPVNLNKLTYINKLTEYQYGQPIMLEMFATWCPPCRQMIPKLAKDAKKYPNVYILSVSKEDEATVKSFAAKVPDMQHYNVAVDSTGELDSFAAKQEVRGIPHAFIFDGAGTLKYNGHPAQCEAVLRELNGSYKATGKSGSAGAGAGFSGASRKL